MDKIHRPRGLIRYISLDELEGKPVVKIYKRPRVIVYFTIMVLAIVGIIYGLSTLSSIELKVLHERQPLFVLRSDGTVQNKYQVKVLNKTNESMRVHVMVTGHESLEVVGVDELLTIPNGHLGAVTVYLRIPTDKLKKERTRIQFRVEDSEHSQYFAEYESMFFGPKKN
jgi:polyferredoxin